MHTTECNCRKRVRADYAEQAAIGAILEMLLSPDILTTITKAAQKIQKESITKPNLHIETQRQKLAEIESRKANILNAIESGLFTNTTNERLKALEQQEELIHKQIASNTSSKEITFFSQNQYEFFLEQLKSGKINSEVFVKSIFRELISQIFIWSDHIVLVYNLQKDVRQTINSNNIKNAIPVEISRNPCPAYKKSSEQLPVRSLTSWLPE